MLRIERLQPTGLAPLDLEIDVGECVAISGASGSGKTLLLRAVADLDPCAGGITLDARSRTDFSGPDWRRHVTYLASDSGWWDERVAEHFVDWHGMSHEAADLGLSDDWGNRTVARLSTGERQRLALLRALERSPAVLLLDEPTSGLDPTATTAVEHLVRTRLRRGLHVLWVTHDVAQAARVGHRRLQLVDGELTAA